MRPVLLVLALFAAGVVVPASANAAYSDPLTTTTEQSLVWHATPAAALTALDDALPNVSANTVAHDGDHAMTGCTSAEKAALPINPTATTAMCWDSDRAGSEAWIPQGITTSGDADDDGMWGADTIILSGWHGTTTLGRNDDARIMFIDYDDPSAPTFRMVYLAVPNSDGSSFTAAKAHMGGMVWYGDKIYVTAVGNTSTAIRVFSTTHILQMTDSSSTIGKTSGGYAAYGYKYAMMQIGYYSYAGGTCDMSSDTGVPCFSSISLDRSTSPDSMVTTEYFSDQSLYGRLYRYDMGSNYLLAAGSSGTVPAAEAYRSHVGNMQGVLSHNGTWYVAHSSATIPGQLWAQTTTGSSSATCGSGTHACWAMHPEALTYDGATGLVWSQSEWAPSDCTAAGQTCGRAVFALPLSSLPLS
jgi:hypothetical protein